MSFQTPNIDFNLFSTNQLPLSKRKLFFIATFKAIISQIVRLYNIFYQYIKGSEIVIYFDISQTYNKEDEVIYNYSVYKSYIDSNTGNTPSSNLDKWQKILSSFIGMEERSRYECKELKLEFALCKYFRKEILDAGFIGFVQPNDNINPTKSTIFIATNNFLYPSFCIGETEQYSSEIGEINSEGWITLTETFGTDSPYSYTINIPTTVYTLINSDSLIAESIVRNFVDKLNISGIYYTIELY